MDPHDVLSSTLESGSSIDSAALLDWDGTLRRGFTMLDWAKFLSDHHHITDRAADSIKSNFERYLAGSITYRHLALSTGRMYASSLKARSVDDTSRLAHSFVSIDDQMFGFTEGMIAVLHEFKIKAIIISGTPQVLLDSYQEALGFDAAFGLDLTIKNGHWLGKIKVNYSTQKQKQKLVSVLVKRFKIVLGIGDTEADRALLESAETSLLVSHPGSTDKEIEGLQRARSVNAGNITQAVIDALTTHLDEQTTTCAS